MGCYPSNLFLLCFDLVPPSHLCSSCHTICMETGLLLLETRAWLLTFKFWLRLLFNSNQNSLTFSMLMAHHASKWLTVIQKKIMSLGISLDAFYLSSASALFQSIKRRLLDIQLQYLSAVSYTHLTLRRRLRCRSRWSPYH